MDEVQVTKVVTPEKVVDINGWGSKEPVTKRPKWSQWRAPDDFVPRKWGDPETEIQKKSRSLKELYEKNKIIPYYGTTLLQSKKEEFKAFGLSFQLFLYRFWKVYSEKIYRSLREFLLK